MREPITRSAKGKPMGGRALTRQQNDNLRDLCRRLMQERGWTQTDLAQKLGVEQGTISGFLNERQGTSFPIAQKIALLSKTHVLALLDEEPTDLSGADEELLAAIEWNRGRYPDKYLRFIARSRAKSEPKSREQHNVDIQNSFADWSKAQREGIKSTGDPSDFDEDPPINKKT